MASAYQGGALPPHNHTTTAGDGGNLNTPTTTDPSTSTNPIATQAFALALNLIGV